MMVGIFHSPSLSCISLGYTPWPYLYGAYYSTLSLPWVCLLIVQLSCGKPEIWDTKPHIPFFQRWRSGEDGWFEVDRTGQMQVTKQMATKECPTSQSGTLSRKLHVGWGLCTPPSYFHRILDGQNISLCEFIIRTFNQGPKPLLRSLISLTNPLNTIINIFVINMMVYIGIMCVFCMHVSVFIWDLLSWDRISYHTESLLGKLDWLSSDLLYSLYLCPSTLRLQSHSTTCNFVHSYYGFKPES